MAKVLRIPQGKYLVGRDIPEGMYLIKTTNFASVHRYRDNNTKEYYHLNNDHPSCRVEIVKGDVLELEEDFTIQRIIPSMIDFD